MQIFATTMCLLPAVWFAAADQTAAHDISVDHSAAQHTATDHTATDHTAIDHTVADHTAASTQLPGGGEREAGIQKPGPWIFEFRDEPLDRVLFVISEQTGTDFIYEPGITAGISVTASLRGKELRHILDELLVPVGLEARRIRTGIFVIRHSLRKEMAPHSLPALQARDLLPTHLSLRRVRAAATENELPLREVILQIAVP